MEKVVVLKTIKKLYVFILMLFCTQNFGQVDAGTYNFKILYKIPTTPVKNQGKSGTCWAFASTSFLENELIRMKKGEFDISEMFTVRFKLMEMATNYIRYQGKANFGEGGQGHDLLFSIDKNGIVPEEIYDGKVLGEANHNHAEMTAVLQGMLDGILKQKKLSTRWKEAINSVLNSYLGTPPENFIYKGKNYSPKSFKDELAINTENYIEITSYTHHPFYSKFVLEVPDNWTNSEYTNIPIDELIEIIDNAIKNGYSIAWDGDSGRDNFLREEGYAIIPLDDNSENFVTPDKMMKEKIITQEDRQIAFDNFDVTDDHLMNLVGIAEDQHGTKYYYTKNSWGTDKKYGGYWYMSEQYVRLKTVAIMVHIDAVPEKIKNKMKL